MEDEERDAGAIARDIFDPQVGHQDVDRTVADEVATDVVDDLILRGGRQPQTAGLDEGSAGPLEAPFLAFLPPPFPFDIERAAQGVLEPAAELPNVRDRP